MGSMRSTSRTTASRPRRAARPPATASEQCRAVACAYRALTGLEGSRTRHVSLPSTLDSMHAEGSRAPAGASRTEDAAAGGTVMAHALAVVEWPRPSRRPSRPISCDMREGTDPGAGMLTGRTRLLCSAANRQPSSVRTATRVWRDSRRLAAWPAMASTPSRCRARSPPPATRTGSTRARPPARSQLAPRGTVVRERPASRRGRSPACRRRRHSRSRR